MKILDQFFGNNRAVLENKLADIRKERDSLGIAFGIIALQIEQGDTSKETLKESDRLSADIRRVVEREQTLASALHALDQQEEKKRAETDTKAAEERLRTLESLQDARHANAVEIDAAIDALGKLVREGRGIHREIVALNPPPSLAKPTGLPLGYFMQIVEFRMRWEPGDTYSPFHRLEDARVATHLPGAPGKGKHHGE